VGLRLERECPWRADPPDLEVVGRALPDRDALMREVRDRKQAAIPTLFDRIELDTLLLDLLRTRAARLLDLRRVELLPFRARHFVAGRVLLALQSFELRQQRRRCDSSAASSSSSLVISTPRLLRAVRTESRLSRRIAGSIIGRPRSTVSSYNSAPALR